MTAEKKKKKKKETKTFNENLEEAAADLRKAGIDAKTTDPVKYAPLTDKQLKSIEQLQKELADIEPKKVGRIDELIIEKNMESGSDDDGNKE